MASLVCGVRNETASSSWNAPLPIRLVSEEPARNKEGKALTEQLPICVDQELALHDLSGIASHPCQTMEDTRTSYQEANPRLACKISISASRIATSLFVSEADKANAQVDCLFGNLNDRNAY